LIAGVGAMHPGNILAWPQGGIMIPHAAMMQLPVVSCAQTFSGGLWQQLVPVPQGAGI